MTPNGKLFTTVDYHTAGEPFRIVTGGMTEISASTVAGRREVALADEDIQATRRLLCHEPRGHADMYGGFLVKPDDQAADLGVLFWHKDGFSTACGHGTIALGVWAVEHGLVEPGVDGIAEVTIDVPSGRVVARVDCVNGTPRAVTFRNVPAYVLARNVEVEVAGKSAQVDLAFGGAVYAHLRASDVGLSVEPGNVEALISAGRDVKRSLLGAKVTEHPEDDRLSGVYGVMIYDELSESESEVKQRNVVIFADGQVDRSPCGSGTSARLALLADEGRLNSEQTLHHISIVDGEFLGRIIDKTTAYGHPAFITDVEGMAYRTGRSEFELSPDDPIGTGFVLR